MKMKKLSLLLLAGLGGAAHANAFLLNEFDARAVGRGNATSATEIDASSIYYNIGGLAAAEGTQVMVSGSLVAPNASFTDSTTMVKDESNTSAQVLPAAFVTSRVHDMVAVGVGFYTPFGLAISWPDGSAQNNIIHTETLHTFFITPSVGVNLGKYVPGLTVGGGIDLVPATVELTQDVYFGAVTGSAHLGATAFGIGGRVGAMYKPPALPQVSVGVMWRSDVKENFSGTGNFDAPAPFRSQLPPDGPVTTSITLPQSLTGGVAYRPIEGLELEGNVVWTNWSKFKELDIAVPAATTGTMTIVQPQAYQDTVTVRVGAEYSMPKQHVAVRAGYIYDPTPIPNTTLTAQLPDVDRNDLCAGATYTMGSYDVSLGLLFVLPSTRQTAMNTTAMPQYQGSYDVSAFVGSLSLNGRFGSL